MDAWYKRIKTLDIESGTGSVGRQDWAGGVYRVYILQ